MNEIDLLRAHGPDAPPTSEDALAAARNRLEAEINAPRVADTGPRWWTLTVPRLAVAGLGLAAIVAVGVAVLPGPDRAADDRPPVAAASDPAVGGSTSAPTGPSARPAGIKLVAVTGPSFPYSLPGLGAPHLTADSGGPIIAVYLADDRSDVYLTTTSAHPATLGASMVATTFDGHPARITTYGPGAGRATIDWEREPGRWVRIKGLGRYGSADAVRKLAAQVRDDPQDVDLHFAVGLVPSGWELSAFKEDGRILTYADPGAPDQGLSVSSVDSLLSDPSREVEDFQKSTTVTVRGRRVPLVQARNFWLIQARLPDGTAFQLMTPRSFTPAQVVKVAASVRLNRS